MGAVMIGSVTQYQQQMADLEKRRKHRDRIGHDLRDDGQVRTGADDVADGSRDAMAAEAAEHTRKSTVAPEGPGTCMEPGELRPQSVDRGYLEQGHASESPQAEAPRLNPMPGMPHYVMPDMPRAAAIPQHVIAHYTGGSPSDR
jgi:hypothetical protein